MYMIRMDGESDVRFINNRGACSSNFFVSKIHLEQKKLVGSLRIAPYLWSPLYRRPKSNSHSARRHKLHKYLWGKSSRPRFIVRICYFPPLVNFPVRCLHRSSGEMAFDSCRFFRVAMDWITSAMSRSKYLIERQLICINLAFLTISKIFVVTSNINIRS